MYTRTGHDKTPCILLSTHVWTQIDTLYMSRKLRFKQPYASTHAHMSNTCFIHSTYFIRVCVCTRTPFAEFPFAELRIRTRACSRLTCTGLIVMHMALILIDPELAIKVGTYTGVIDLQVRCVSLCVTSTRRSFSNSIMREAFLRVNDTQSESESDAIGHSESHPFGNLNCNWKKTQQDNVFKFSCWLRPGSRSRHRYRTRAADVHHRYRSIRIHCFEFTQLQINIQSCE